MTEVVIFEKGDVITWNGMLLVVSGTEVKYDENENDILVYNLKAYKGPEVSNTESFDLKASVATVNRAGVLVK
jgi:hypothetical protein